MNKSLIQSLDYLNRFLAVREGDGIAEATALRKQISYYDNKLAALDRDFFTTTINSGPKIGRFVEALLDSLDIPAAERGRYTGSPLTVHAFLTELVENNKESNERFKDNNQKLKAFIALIDNTSRIRWYNVISNLSFALLGIELSLLYAGASFIEQIVTEALFVPVASLLASIGIVAYSLYQNLFDTKKPLSERFKENLFILANAGLTIAAKSIIIASASIAPPVSFILLAFASGVSLIHEITRFVQVVVQGKKPIAKKNQASLSILQRQARQDIDYDMRRNAILNNLLEALLLTGIAIVWCFVPGSFFVTAGLIAASLIVSIAKKMVQKYNESTMKECLKKKFAELENPYKKLQKSQSRIDFTTVSKGKLDSLPSLEQPLDPVIDTKGSEYSLVTSESPISSVGTAAFCKYEAFTVAPAEAGKHFCASSSAALSMDPLLRKDDTKEYIFTGRGSSGFFSKSPSLSFVSKANLNEDVVSYCAQGL